MIIRVFTQEQLNEAAAFSRRLCRENRTRSYPLFPDADAMKTEYRWSLTHPGGFLAGCCEDGALEGVVCGFSEVEGKYLQTTGFYVPAKNRAAARALAGWLAETYPGYTANIGLPADNDTVAGVLTERGYHILDDSLDLRLQTGDFHAPQSADGAVFRVDQSTLPEYLPYHRQYFGDCYWNAERLRESFENWDVYAHRTGPEITGGLFMRPIPPDTAEIYGLHTEAEATNLSLLSFALEDLLSRRPKTASVIFMADAADKPSAASALKLGFRQENHYRCYAKPL